MGAVQGSGCHVEKSDSSHWRSICKPLICCTFKLVWLKRTSAAKDLREQQAAADQTEADVKRIGERRGWGRAVTENCFSRSIHFGDGIVSFEVSIGDECAPKQ